MVVHSIDADVDPMFQSQIKDLFSLLRPEDQSRDCMFYKPLGKRVGILFFIDLFDF